MGLHPQRHFNLERSYRRNSSPFSIMRKTNMLVVFTFLLLSLPVFVTNVKAVSYQAGKVNITDKSQNNHGCESVSFETQFQGSQDVKVVLTLGHGSQFTKILDPVALWVKSLSTSGFEACTVVPMAHLRSVGSHSKVHIKAKKLELSSLMNFLPGQSARIYRPVFKPK